MCGGGGLGGIVNTIKKIDPLRGGDVVLDKLGLPSIMGDENGLLASNDMVLQSGAPDPADQATNVAGDVQAARDDEKRRRAAAAGMSSTILGGSMAGTQTARKTLLGQ